MLLKSDLIYQNTDKPVKPQDYVTKTSSGR